MTKFIQIPDGDHLSAREMAFGKLPRPELSAEARQVDPNAGLDATAMALQSDAIRRAVKSPDRIAAVMAEAPVLMSTVLEQKREWVQVFVAAYDTEYLTEVAPGTDVMQLLEDMLVARFDVPRDSFRTLISIKNTLHTQYWFASLFGSLPREDFIPTLALLVRFLDGTPETVPHRYIADEWLVWRLWILAQKVGYPAAHTIVGKLSGWLYADSQAEMTLDTWNELAAEYPLDEWSRILQRFGKSKCLYAPTAPHVSGFVQLWHLDLHRWIRRLTRLYFGDRELFDAFGPPSTPLLERVVLDRRVERTHRNLGLYSAYLAYFRNENFVARAIDEAGRFFQVLYECDVRSDENRNLEWFDSVDELYEYSGINFEIDLLVADDMLPSRLVVSFGVGRLCRECLIIKPAAVLVAPAICDLNADTAVVEAHVATLFAPSAEAWNRNAYARFHGGLATNSFGYGNLTGD